VASKLCEENIKLNKLKGKVISLNGDAAEIIKEQLRDKADRVLMLLPERSDEFLDIAISSLRKNGVIHYYSHIHAEKKQDAPKLSEEHFLNINKIQAKIMTSRVVRPVGPRFYQTVVDVKIQKN
jgi:tRNA (guanine37-N1)-methyltransferase